MTKHIKRVSGLMFCLMVFLMGGMFIKDMGILAADDIVIDIDYVENQEDVDDSDYIHVPNVRFLDGEEVVYETGDMKNQASFTVTLPKIQNGYTVSIIRTFTAKRGGKVYQEESRDFTVGELDANDHQSIHVGMLSEPRNMDEVIIVESVADSATDSSQKTNIPIGLILGGAVVVAGGAFLAMKGKKFSKGETDSNKSKFDMIFGKDGSDKLRYDQKPTLIWAKIIETRADGLVIDRNDLSENIDFRNQDGKIVISEKVFDGSAMHARILANKEEPGPAKIILSYKGQQGLFENHMAFQIIGEPSIEVDDVIYLLSGSHMKKNVAVKMVDFLEIPKVTIEPVEACDKYSYELKEDIDQAMTLALTESDTTKEIKTFYEGYRLRIKASNEKEQAEKMVTVYLCYEGILADFLGKEPVLEGKRDEQGQIIETLVAFKASRWDETTQTLEIGRPNALKVDYDHEHDDKIFSNLGVRYEQDDQQLSDGVIYKFIVENCLPAAKNVEGMLIYSGDYLGQSYENSQSVSITPDLLDGRLEIMVEYEKCKYIIQEYLPVSFQKQKLASLETMVKKASNASILYDFRVQVWNIASRAILQEKEKYMINSYWYDELIGEATVIVDLGNIAFDIAVAPFGGPITGFFASQIKDGSLQLLDMWMTQSDFGWKDVQDFISKRVEQGLGLADGLVEMPDLTNPKNYSKFAIWISAYGLYRIYYHLSFDEDEGHPIGYIEATRRGIFDMAGKAGASMMSGQIREFVKHYKVKSVAEADQALVNKGMTAAMDVADDLAVKADNLMDQFIEQLMEFVEKIKSAEITF